MSLVTLFSDSFARANENPLSDGGQWANFNEQVSNQLQISGSFAIATVASARNNSIVTGTSFPNSQWAQATLSIFNSGAGAVPYILLRATGSGAGANAVYRLDWDRTSNTVRILSMINGVFVTLASSSSMTVVGGDILRFEAQGAALRGYRNGTQVVSATDSTVTTGSPGLGDNPQATNTDVRWTNFSAGKFSAAPDSLMTMGCGL
jgi:hypothetical protein